MPSAALESVWSVTDPPLKALRRVIPPLRLGTVSFDLASLVLLVILFVLMKFVVEPLIIECMPDVTSALRGRN